MKAKQDAFVPGALNLAEEAVHLLRLGGAAVLAEYYVGTLPFIGGLLYFWSDMSRNPFAAWHCAPAAAGLALLFIWMKLWQVRFCRRLHSLLNHAGAEAWPWSRCWSAAARQSLLQASGMLVVPLAVLFLVPLAWVYAFYQNASVLDPPGNGSLKVLYRQAAEQAALWPGQNHLILSIISVFALFVLANVAAGLMLLPYLIKWLLGIETAFTVSGPHALLNTTFLAIACALSYVCIDPIVKAVYTLRCFYGQSRRTGDDLNAALKPFLKTGMLLMLLWFGGASVAFAGSVQGGAAAQAPDAHVFVERLDRTIEEVLQERRFAWRLPRETMEESPPRKEGWLMRGLAWLTEKIRAVLEAVDRWLESLRKLFPAPDRDRAAGSGWQGAVRFVGLGLGLGFLFLLAVFVRRLYLARLAARRRRGVAGREEIVPDIDDENILANDLPRDQWLGMARDLMAREDMRQAVRALYLALLAQLGDHGRLSIARYKSNRDYHLELMRRAHAEPELLDRFHRCMSVYERVWYGMHPVAAALFAQFVADEERIAALVQHAA